LTSGALETLDKLGVPVVGLPKQALPAHLAKYQGDAYANVGSLTEPAFERVFAARPDLIIISGRQQAMYDEFRAIAPTIYLGVDFARYMESFEENVRLLAAIFGKEEQAEAELAAIKQSVDELKALAAEKGGPALVVLVNEGRASAYGPGSRYGMIHDDFGFPPVDAGIVASTHGQSISFEYILEKNPEYLFVIDRTAAIGGQSSAKATIENDLVKMTRAYQNGNIIYLDPAVWYLSGAASSRWPRWWRKCGRRWSNDSFAPAAEDSSGQGKPCPLRVLKGAGAWDAGRRAPPGQARRRPAGWASASAS